MRPRLMMPLLLLSCAGLLTGCASLFGVKKPPDPRVIVQTEIRSVDVPATLLSCAKAPLVPGKEASQRGVATYVVRLKANRDECAGKLAATSTVLADHKKAVNDFNASNVAASKAAP